MILGDRHGFPIAGPVALRLVVPKVYLFLLSKVITVRYLEFKSEFFPC